MCLAGCITDFLSSLKRSLLGLACMTKADALQFQRTALLDSHPNSTYLSSENNARQSLTLNDSKRGGLSL